MQHRDRDDQILERGDRVRLVKNVGWQVVEGKRQRLLGLYAYVKDTETSATAVTVQLEEDKSVSVRVMPHQLALAPGMVEPDTDEAQVAQSGADVMLVERFPYRGQPEYSIYRIGEDEGTATLIHHSRRWELTFAEVGAPGAEFDGGEASEYDDSPSGAWHAWNRLRSQMN